VALSERVEFIIRPLFLIVVLMVYESLWGAVIDETGGPVASYDYRALIWYVVAAQSAVIGISPRLIEEIGDDIGGGTIAVEMLRPVSVLLFRVAAGLGDALVRSFTTFAIGIAFVIVTVGPPPDGSAILLALPAVGLAAIANMASQYAFAGAAFWIEDAKGSWFLYQKLIFIVGGMLIPLEFFPGGLETLARYLPFWTMAYVPGRLMAGHVEPWLLLIQLGWIAVLYPAAAFIFRAGERRMQVVGG
jgi:ABC-2 type transport system permease protein